MDHLGLETLTKPILKQLLYDLNTVLICWCTKRELPTESNDMIWVIVMDVGDRIAMFNYSMPFL